MNPYRCETCKKPHLVPDGLSRHPHFFCCDQEMPSDTATSTEMRGCASHSDFQNQREQVLDELQKFVDLCRDNAYYPEMSCGVMSRWIEGRKIQLREGGGL